MSKCNLWLTEGTAMRNLIGLFLTLCLCGSANGTIVQLDAIDSTSRYLGQTGGGGWWNQDKLAVQSIYASWNNTIVASYGYVKFDLSPLPVDAVITNLTLTASFMEIRQDAPEHNALPALSVFRVSDDTWVREGWVSIDVNERLSSAQTNYTSWDLDVSAANWSTDLVDGYLSVAVANETIPTFAVPGTDFTFNYVYLYGSDTELRPTLTVTYVPEPSGLSLLLVGILLVRKARVERGLDK